MEHMTAMELLGHMNPTALATMAAEIEYELNEMGGLIGWAPTKRDILKAIYKAGEDNCGDEFAQMVVDASYRIGTSMFKAG